MFKIIGGVIIVICCGLLGINKSNNLKKKHLNLKEFRLMTDELKTEIVQNNTHLPVAIKQIGLKYNNSCFLNCSELINEFGGEESFIKALTNTAHTFCFDDDDINAVSTIATRLGRCDEFNQVIRLDYAMREIDKQITSASKEFSEKSKIYTSCSFLVGVIIFILFV